MFQKTNDFVTLFVRIVYLAYLIDNYSSTRVTERTLWILRVLFKSYLSCKRVFELYVGIRVIRQLFYLLVVVPLDFLPSQNFQTIWLNGRVLSI